MSRYQKNSIINMPRKKAKKNTIENQEVQIREEGPILRKPDWLSIPLYLLTDISHMFIDIKDYIRFGAVCRLWQSSCVEISNHRPPCVATRQLPLLMLHVDRDNNLETCLLYSFPERRKLSKFQLQLPSNGYSLCSTEGWLVFIPNDNQSRVTLFNPFCAVSNKIELPLLYSSPFIWDSSFRKKAVLSANPATSSNYVVMVIYVSGHQGFSFFKSGDKEWTHLDFEGFKVEDTIYYKEQFYFLDRHEKVFAFDVSLHQHVQSQIEEGPPKRCGMRKYLVVSSEDLLLIRSWCTYTDKTVEFNVFKLDMRGKKWDAVNSLGDQALFIGNNCSIAVSSLNFLGCKPNSIYFIGLGDNDVGVFNMEDGKIELDNEVESTRRYPAPIWIEPTLQK
ncbi:hypothetical protein ACHQM5_000728 [Ranunculus cassubicifolius]